MYFLGLDVGSVSVKIALLDPEGQLLHSAYLRHQGRPFHTILAGLTSLGKEVPLAKVHAPMVTGNSAKKMAELLGGEALGEVMCLTLAAKSSELKAKSSELKAKSNALKAKSLIDIGGEDTKVLWFKEEGGLFALSDFAMNSLCAAGTGSFLDQQAHRLGYDIHTFASLALKSEVPPRVAGRCSVFAKSDMIHLQQSATPDYEIIYGLCLAMARSLKSGLAKGRNLAPPVLFSGGVAANGGLIRALEEILQLAPGELIVPKTHFVYGALGAALAAKDEYQNISPEGLSLAALDNWLKAPHDPPSRQKRLIRRKDRPRQGTFDWSQVPEGVKLPVYIGVDVGSVSTNIAVVTEDGTLLSRQYLPTASRPLEAITIGFSQVPCELREKTEVLGVCTTGSGRYLSADFIGADMTVNEITAQATAAYSIDPTVDTIFEIGGQDSKYIYLSNGVIVDFMMNKACAAGTGSFLEEQADKLGIQIKEQFGSLALKSQNPVSLGERCTVFMESDLVHHQQNGVALEDLVAGLCHGIVANYLGRVVETRKVGENIFFQGGTSFNEGVAAAFESHLGKPITVPDNADVTGAMGAAFIARDRRTWKESSFVGYDLSNREYNIKSFECRHCANHCEIRKVTVSGGRPYFYGSRCDRYEEDQGRKKASTHSEDLFKFRLDAAFNPIELQALDYGTKKPYKGRIGLIRSMFFAELGPFFSVFLASLGYEPVFSPPTNKTTIHKGCERTEGEFCFPIKAAHGHILELMDMDLDHIFIPSLVNMPPAQSINGNAKAPDNAACPYVQSLAFTAPACLGLTEPFLLRGTVFFGEGEKPLEKSLLAIASKLKASRSEALKAISQAKKAQEAFCERLMAKGREVLQSLAPDQKAIVVVGRPYNSYDSALNLRLGEKLSDLKLVGIPMDLLPLDLEGDEPASHYWRYGQKITAAAQFIANEPRLDAVYISNFGCGPDSFILHFFRHALASKPFLEIEIDEHSSDVGAVTRLEAFLDSQALKAKKPESDTPLCPYEPKLAILKAPLKGKTIYIPPMCDHTRAISATLRSSGLETVALCPSDHKTIELGRSQTSGKECFPLILTVGDFLKLSQSSGFDPQKASLFMPSSNGPCRFGQYSRYLSLVLKRLGLEEVKILSLDQTGGMYDSLNKLGSKKGTALTKEIWRSLVSVDLLQKALYFTRPRETKPGLADKVYEESLQNLEHTLEHGSYKDLYKTLGEAREAFAGALNGTGDAILPKVGLVGEIYVRSNEFANEQVIRRLESLGAEVSVPPFVEWILYTGFVNKMRAKRVGNLKKSFFYWLTMLVQHYELDKLAKAFKGFIPELKEPPVTEVVRLGEKFLDSAFQGEAILSLGKGLEYYQHGARGLVNIMPFTCMPGMVVGGLATSFRHEAGSMPLLNLAFDGQSQTNTQARLEAFMYQVTNFSNPFSPKGAKN